MVVKIGRTRWDNRGQGRKPIPLETQRIVFDTWMDSRTSLIAAQKLKDKGIIRDTLPLGSSSSWVRMTAKRYVILNPEYCRQRLIDGGSTSFTDDETWKRWLVKTAVCSLYKKRVRVEPWAKEHGLLSYLVGYNLKGGLTPDNIVIEEVSVEKTLNDLLARSKPVRG